MARARRGVESSRVDHGSSPKTCGDGGKLWESHVVADGQAETAKCTVEDSDAISTRQCQRLLEGHLAGNVDVKQVNLKGADPNER